MAEVSFEVKAIVLALFHWGKVKKDSVNFGTIAGLDLRNSWHLLSCSQQLPIRRVFPIGVLESLQVTSLAWRFLVLREEEEVLAYATL